MLAIQAHGSLQNESYYRFTSRTNDIKPMRANEVQMVMLDSSKAGCKIKLSKYYIKKEVRNKDTYFFASLDKTFIRTKNPELIKNYRSQIGYTLCTPGYIEVARVNGQEQDIDARNCGIGTIFATLCMIDPDLNMLPNLRIDVEFYDDPRTAKIIKKSCRKFLGMHMVAETVAGPYMNFNAALKTGYNKFLIKTEKDVNLWLDTESVKYCYDPKTGMIGDGIQGLGNNWWFCEEIPGKLPKFPSLKICHDRTSS